MPRALILILTLALAGCSGSNPSSPSGGSSPSFTQTDLVIGTGAAAAAGNTLRVAYTGWLYDAAQTDAKGRQFDSSPDYTFTLGIGRVIRGWDQGVAGMRAGGQRRLVIPPDLAYGAAGAPPAIPPNASLVFDITLLDVR